MHGGAHAALGPARKRKPAYGRAMPLTTLGHTLARRGVARETGRCYSWGMENSATDIDALACMRGLQSSGTIACATRGMDGAPRVRFLSGLHFELDAVYLLASRGMPFARQLMRDDRIQLLSEVKPGVSVRLTGHAVPVPEEEQVRWRLVIFDERPRYRDLYPAFKHDDSLVFVVRDGFFEWLDLVSEPILRVYVPFGNGRVVPSGYRIGETCTRCGTCLSSCPQHSIVSGNPFRIVQEHCLQCGACVKTCPRQAIVAV